MANCNHCPRILLCLLKPLNALVAFFEFIAFIIYTPQLVPYSPNSLLYWMLAALIGAYACTFMFAAMWLVSTENYRQQFFPWAAGYPPLRMATFGVLYWYCLEGSNSAEVFLVQFDLGAVVLVTISFLIAAIRGYGQQEPPEKQAIVYEICV